MKLDIEALGKEAGGTAVDHDDPQCWIGQLAFNKAALEALARLIVERCAVIVDTNADGCQRNSDMRLVLQSNASAIRQLLEDK